MKMLYKYPQGAFPYDDLVQTNHSRTRHDPEYELVDTGIFAENRYFDVTVEYAKAEPTDILVRISATNRGARPPICTSYLPCGSATHGAGARSLTRTTHGPQSKKQGRT